MRNAPFHPLLRLPVLLVLGSGCTLATDFDRSLLDGAAAGDALVSDTGPLDAGRDAPNDGGNGAVDGAMDGALDGAMDGALDAMAPDSGLCGNRSVDVGEECDDGDGGGDGCDACVVEPGYTCPAGGGDCEAILCAVDQHVVTHACVDCPAGSTRPAGDDATGVDTSCDPTLCAVDQHVVTHACVDCPAGSTRPAGDDATGVDTSCDPTLCAVDQHVVTNACVDCGAGTINEAGDDATGGDTTCDTVATLRLVEVAPNQSGSADLMELEVLTAGTVRNTTIEESATPSYSVLVTLPDLTVAMGDLIVVHLNAGAGVVTELTTETDCSDTACHSGAWDVVGGTTGIAYSNRVLGVVDPFGDFQDVVAFSNGGGAPADYPDWVQGVQASGDWLPADCGGAACTYGSTPTVVDISASWAGAGTIPAGDSAQRMANTDTDQSSDWVIQAGSLGTANP